MLIGAENRPGGGPSLQDWRDKFENRIFVKGKGGRDEKVRESKEEGESRCGAKEWGRREEKDEE